MFRRVYDRAAQPGAGVPNALIATVPGLDRDLARKMATHAAEAARLWAPKMSGQGADSIAPHSGEGFYGITWGESYLWFQERGIKPFTMRSLAGKLIPMWVNDPDGSQARKIPVKDRNRRMRRSKDGRNQVLIFRRAAPIGSRKDVERNGRIVNVPRSYPGAPGRIVRRDEHGQILGGNVGVRWRHPGMNGRDFMADAIIETARQARVLPASIDARRI